MNPAGYAGTPLKKKLGIVPGIKLLFLNTPTDYFKLLGADLTSQIAGRKDLPDIVHLFAENKKHFEKEMKLLLPLAKRNPAMVIWVSWYKKSSKIPTDLSEDGIRDFALRNGLVDVKVCAVNEIWSALKLVVPLSNR